MRKDRFQGTGTALVTPFAQDGSVDEQALSRLVDFQIDAGIDMIAPECAIPLATKLENLLEIPKAVRDWSEEHNGGEEASSG